MRPTATYVARSVVCVCLSVLGTRVSCAKTAEPIEMLFGGLTQMGTKNDAFRWGSPQIPQPEGALFRGKYVGSL